MTKPLSYYSWPLSITAFFLVLAVANVRLYQVANDSHDESKMVTTGAYEQGLKYQERLDALERFKRAGLTAKAAIVHESETASLLVQLMKADGTPLTGRKLKVSATYGASSDYDQELNLAEDGEGSGNYRAPIKAAPGVFLIAVQFQDAGDQTFAFDTRIQ